ncbi:MAG: hypothetical protein WBE26_05770 [Phycisphaerae bacterium]
MATEATDIPWSIALCLGICAVVCMVAAMRGLAEARQLLSDAWELVRWSEDFARRYPTHIPFALPTRDDARAADPAQDEATTCCGPEPPKPVLPSDLLRLGWSRIIAEDANGDLIPSNHSRARAWSVFGAGFGAFGEGTVRSQAYYRRLTEILRERYGGPTFAAWNSDPRRNLCEVIGVALEAERRMSAENLISDDGDDPPRCRANQQ